MQEKSNGVFDRILDFFTKKDEDLKPFSPKEDLDDVTQPLKTGRYMKPDSISTANQWLGRASYIQEGMSKAEPFPISIKPKIDKDSENSQPLKLSELIVDKKVGATVDILQYINLDSSVEGLLEVVVIKNATARIDMSSDEWVAAMRKWKNLEEIKQILDDPKTQNVSVVVGAAQIHLITKVFDKVKVTGKAGFYGVNAKGEFYTSTSKYELNIVYEIDEIPLNIFLKRSASRGVGFSPPTHKFQKFEAITDPDQKKKVLEKFSNQDRFLPPNK